MGCNPPRLLNVDVRFIKPGFKFSKGIGLRKVTAINSFRVIVPFISGIDHKNIHDNLVGMQEQKYSIKQWAKDDQAQGKTTTVKVPDALE